MPGQHSIHDNNTIEATEAIELHTVPHTTIYADENIDLEVPSNVQPRLVKRRAKFRTFTIMTALLVGTSHFPSSKPKNYLSFRFI